MPRRKNNLSFISNTTLQNKIRESIELTSILYIKRNEKDADKWVVKEFCRMEILYAASIIEAVLLYVFKEKNFSLDRMNYKEVHILPKHFQADQDRKVVVATQIKKTAQERELMLDSLVSFFYKKKLITKTLKGRIDSVRKVRNTFHLSKSRHGIRCDADSVNTAYDTVIQVFAFARRILK